MTRTVSAPVSLTYRMCSPRRTNLVSPHVHDVHLESQAVPTCLKDCFLIRSQKPFCRRRGAASDQNVLTHTGSRRDDPAGFCHSYHVSNWTGERHGTAMTSFTTTTTTSLFAFQYEARETAADAILSPRKAFANPRSFLSFLTSQHDSTLHENLSAKEHTSRSLQPQERVDVGEEGRLQKQQVSQKDLLSQARIILVIQLIRCTPLLTAACPANPFNWGNQGAEKSSR